MKRIVYTRPDGGVSVVTPVGSLQEVYERSIPADATNIHECDHTDIPADRTFRNAWAQGAAKLPEVNMPKARDIHMDRIREKRNAKLAELDLAYIIADENNDGPGKAAIAQQKKKLRDLPATYDLSGHATPDTLKDDWPIEVQ